MRPTSILFATFICLGFIAFIQVCNASNAYELDLKYICNGECNVTRERCKCTDECVQENNCCSDYFTSCKGQEKWMNIDCAKENEMVCPDGYEEPIVIWFSVDGFRADYLDRGLTPNIERIGQCGVHAPYMRPVFPTETFPNHYSMATGLYPESSGIVANTFYDYDIESEFNPFVGDSAGPEFWNGEPIWNTVSNQGKKSAAFYWVGTDVNITRHPDYWFPYGSIKNEERMYQALDWLDLPVGQRPSILMLYISIVDHDGHIYGPFSPEVDETIMEADRIIGLLMEGLRNRDLQNCVNLIIVSDHGMSPISCDDKILLDDFGVDNIYLTDGGAAATVNKPADKQMQESYNAEEVNNALRCKHDETHFQTFTKEYIPRRLHHSRSERIGDITLLMDDNWSTYAAEEGLANYCETHDASHGWDNQFKSMNALFSAHGPAFKRQMLMEEPFNNIELYNVVAGILDVSPAPNNGTQGSLNHIMSQDTTLPSENGIPLYNKWADPNLPDDFLDYGDCDVCVVDGKTDMLDANQRLLDYSNAIDYQSTHLLYGEILTNGGDGSADEACLLTHEKYISAYLAKRKLPLYSSFTIEKPFKGSKSLKSLSDTPDRMRVCSRLDPRYYLSNTSNGDADPLCQSLDMNDDICSQYVNTMYSAASVYLFPVEWSGYAAAEADALIDTNLVPMYPAGYKVWNHALQYIVEWANKWNGINVIVGPAFDYNHDSLYDSQEDIDKWADFMTSDNSSPVPTHYYIVVSKCMDGKKNIKECNNVPSDIETIAFILPNYKVEPCHEPDADFTEWIPGTVMEHVATIDDVEKITNLKFLTKWTHVAENNQHHNDAVRKKLYMQEFRQPWLDEFLNKDKPYNSANILVGTSISNYLLLAFMCVFHLFYSF